MKNKIKIFKDHRSLRIYIDEILHVEILIGNYNGLQSWLEGSKKKMFFIEFYFKQGNSIILEYDEFDMWKTILRLIDENI